MQLKCDLTFERQTIVHQPNTNERAQTRLQINNFRLGEKKLNPRLGDHACHTHNLAIHIYRCNSTTLYAMVYEHLTEKQDWDIRSALVK